MLSAHFLKSEIGGMLKLFDTVSDDGKTVLDVLREKHLPNHPPFLETLVTPRDLDDFSYSIFQALDCEAIKHAALHTSGTAGPSLADAAPWHWWCTCYNTSSAALCSSLALVGHRICTTCIDPLGLTVFNACCLIPLDKCPGVHPIGVAEVCCRMIGKAIMKIVKSDIQEAVAGHQFVPVWQVDARQPYIA